MIIYVDPAYLKTYFTRYPKKIEFSKWPDPIDGLPGKLLKVDIILITHDHADHCKKVTIDRLRKKNMKKNWTILYSRYRKKDHDQKQVTNCSRNLQRHFAVKSLAGTS